MTSTKGNNNKNCTFNQKVSIGASFDHNILKSDVENQNFPLFVKMFLKPLWVGKIYGAGVYATHSVRIWWFRNIFDRELAPVLGTYMLLLLLV